MSNLHSFVRDFEKSFIGYDNILRKMSADLAKDTAWASAQTNFPPYNIRKVDDSKYVIEMAVAGFGKQDIEITLEEDKLIIRGDSKSDDGEYLFKGLAARAFQRQFTLNDQVVVNNASMMNGILKVFLERIIPEHKKPRKIQIEDEATTVSNYIAHSQPQLLTEADHEATDGRLM